MSKTVKESDAPHTPQEIGEAFAAQIGDKQWEIDPSDLLVTPPEFDAGPSEALIPESKTDVPLAAAAVESDVPPSPLQIIEAMLFIGGQPLMPAKACQIIRGLSINQFNESIEVLNRVYRLQNRPYHVVSAANGCTLAVRPRFRYLKERIYGGPREARLTQPALDVLALVAYRQPAVKAEIDAVRGADSGHVLRQLVRLGLIAVVHRAEAKQREVAYGTTQRFLDLFNLRALDDLPLTGDAQRL
jgi:segregation and condensation protein B